jgi:hypothetical protein
MDEQKVVVPSSDESFDKRFALVAQMVSRKTGGGADAERTHIPTEKVTDLSARYTTCRTAYAKILTPHTSVDTTGKNVARDAAGSVLRKFIQRCLYDADDVVTNASLQSMELPVCGHAYTRHGRSEEHVEVETRPHEVAEISIDYRRVETGGRPSRRKRTRLRHCIWKVLEDGEAVPEPEALQLSRLSPVARLSLVLAMGCADGGWRFWRHGKPVPAKKVRLAPAWWPLFRVRQERRRWRTIAACPTWQRKRMTGGFGLFAELQAASVSFLVLYVR